MVSKQWTQEDEFKPADEEVAWVDKLTEEEPKEAERAGQEKRMWTEVKEFVPGRQTGWGNSGFRQGLTLQQKQQKFPQAGKEFATESPPEKRSFGETPSGFSGQSDRSFQTDSEQTAQRKIDEIITAAQRVDIAQCIKETEVAYGNIKFINASPRKKEINVNKLQIALTTVEEVWNKTSDIICDYLSERENKTSRFKNGELENERKLHANIRETVFHILEKFKYDNESKEKEAYDIIDETAREIKIVKNYTQNRRTYDNSVYKEIQGMVERNRTRIQPYESQPIAEMGVVGWCIYESCNALSATITTYQKAWKKGRSHMRELQQAAGKQET